MITADIDRMFTEFSYWIAPQLIPPDRIAGLSSDIWKWPSRRVSCGIPNVQWTEQIIPEESALFNAFLDPSLVETLYELLHRSAPYAHLHVLCWLSRYGVGEYINPHRDAAGDIQVILGIKSPVAHGGGYLCLRRQDAVIECLLRPGDAVIFRATELEHYTTPLVATEATDVCERLVAVGRYTFV